jgi:hypothetical protein
MTAREAMPRHKRRATHSDHGEVLIKELAQDEAIAEADTLLLAR